MRRYILICMLLVVVTGPAITAALTAHVQTFSVSGHITVEGRGWNDGVTVWTDRDHVARTGAGGGYTIIDLPDGEHIVHAWSERCLPRIIDTVQVSGADVTDVDGTLFAGDLNEDGRINLHDAGIILAAYHATPDSADWNVAFDLDGSSVIDSFDVAMLIDRWKERGNSTGPPTDMVVIDPDSETVWYPGQPDVPISWDTGNLGGSISINLYRADDHVHTILNRTQNDGSFTVHALPSDLDYGTDYRIRIALYYDESREAYSDYFEVRPFFDVTVPNELTIWYTEQQDVSIRWDPNDLEGNISISLYKGNGFIEFLTMSTPNDGYYDEWDVPADLEAGTDYRVKVNYGDYRYGYSDYFEMARSEIVVLEPNSSTVWYYGQSDVPIIWETGYLGGTVSIVLYHNLAEIDTIALSTPNDGYHSSYDVPGDLPYSEHYRIRIFFDESRYDFSGEFTIRPYFIVTEPIDSTVWYYDDTDLPIRWEPGDIAGNVSLNLYKGGLHYDQIAILTPNNGEYICEAVSPLWEPGGDYSVCVYCDDGHYGCSNSFSISTLPPLWHWQNPELTGNELMDVAFSDAQTGTAVGAAGSILRTTNGGDAWSVQESGTTEYLYGVHFIDVNTGTIVGGNGTILRTTDAGATWIPLDGGTSKALYDVCYSGSAGGIAGDNCTVLITVDGGATWAPPEEAITGWCCPSVPMHSIAFAEPLTALITGGEGHVTCLFGTSDGGQHWDLLYSNQFEVGLRNIAFASGSTATAVGARDVYWSSYVGPISAIFHTTNGGESWSDIPHTLIYGTLYGVAYADTNLGIAVGDGGAIYRTMDSGATWAKMTSPTSNTLNGVSFGDISTGTAVGRGGTIVRTSNGGGSWTLETDGVALDKPLYDVQLIDELTGFAVGGGGTIMRTTNGGEEWHTLESGVSASQTLYDCSFPTPDTGYAVGAYLTAPEWGYYQMAMLKTTDGGDTWLDVSEQYNAKITGVHFTDPDTGTIVGKYGFIIRTTNGGGTWVKQTSGTNDDLLAVFFTNSLEGIAVGENGRVIRTTDGGASWLAVASGTSTWLRDVHFIDEDTGTIVGDDGTILRSTNGGTTWMRQTSPVTDDLQAVHFISADHGVIVGLNGTMLWTPNGGRTWFELDSRTRNHLYGVFFTNPFTGNAVGESGTILRASP